MFRQTDSSMKKIGIITIVKVNNYGAELQAFALQRKLELLGYQPEIIDYLYYKDWRFRDSRRSRPLVPLGLRGRLAYFAKYRVAGMLADTLLPLLSKDARLRKERFASFHGRNTKFSRAFRSMPALYSASLGYDVYMVGSDQVWNPSASSSIEPYFLTFAPAGAKRISYASSFGVSSISGPLQGRYKELLANIESVSVREDSGVELVRSLTGREARLVADPTLLLSKGEWSGYMVPDQDAPARYVLIYDLSDSDAVTRMALHIGTGMGLPVLRVCKRAFNVRKDAGVRNILDAGPAEFLHLVAHAAFVVTNSFHGTAFSVNFNVPFLTVVSARKKNNSRMASLLDAVGLSGRLVVDDAGDGPLPSLGVDFSGANSALARLRQASVDFLVSNLK